MIFILEIVFDLFVFIFKRIIFEEIIMPIIIAPIIYLFTKKKKKK